LAFQLVAIAGLAVVQAIAGSPDVFDSGLGVALAYAWLALSLASFAAAALKAYDNRQMKWLIGLVLFWPLMYPYVF
jgi:hypothetical protein